MTQGGDVFLTAEFIPDGWFQVDLFAIKKNQTSNRCERISAPVAETHLPPKSEPEPVLDRRFEPVFARG